MYVCSIKISSRYRIDPNEYGDILILPFIIESLVRAICNVLLYIIEAFSRTIIFYFNPFFVGDDQKCFLKRSTNALGN